MKWQLFSKGCAVPEKVLFKKFGTEQAGIFETLRAYHGCIFRLAEHIGRLVESARTSGFPGKIDPAVVESELYQSLEAFGRPDAVMRLTLLGDERWVMIGERKHPESLYKEGVALKTTAVKRSASNAGFPEAKTSGYQNAVLASLVPRPGEVYEWVFLDRRGYVSEVRIGNIFIIKRQNGKNAPPLLITPPCEGILNGVTRRFVIECGLRSAMKVQETPLTRHDIYNADEAFLTNTTWEILPIRQLDGRRIGGMIPGPQTRKLQHLFKQGVLQECRIPSSRGH